MLYGHGDDTYAYQKIEANFSSNVWYQGYHKSLAEHLRGALEVVQNYPEPAGNNLAEKLAQLHKIGAENMMITNGAVEAFYLITKAWTGTSATIFSPTFSEYEDAANYHGLDIIHVAVDQLLEHNIQTRLVFICNPNNPTGQIIDREPLMQLIEKNPDTIFIVDEAYVHFCEERVSVLSKVGECPNLIVVRSLTKIFAIPGLRLGYIAGSPALINQIKQYKLPWSVNALAIEAGMYIAAYYNDLIPEVKPLLESTQQLRKALAGIDGIEPLPTQTTYFLMKLEKGTSTELKQFLADRHQVLIRDAANFRGLDRTYARIATQSENNNQKLINGISAWSGKLS